MVYIFVSLIFLFVFFFLFFSFFFFFFFFQAEDGIRDGRVTGVQTCALPISPAQPQASSSLMMHPVSSSEMPSPPSRSGKENDVRPISPALRTSSHGNSSRSSSSAATGRISCSRSEERRVGKEGRSGGSPEHQ